MRRHWLWIAGVTLLLALAGLTGVVVFSKGQFEFLAGNRPLPVRDARQLKQLGVDTQQLRFYSIKADFEPLVKGAAAELKRSGFKIDPSSGKNWAAFDGPTKGQRITFQNNGRRLTEVSVRSLWAPGSGTPGWVLIVFDGVEEPSVLDRFKQWLGF